MLFIIKKDEASITELYFNTWNYITIFSPCVFELLIFPFVHFNKGLLYFEIRRPTYLTFNLSRATFLWYTLH